MYTDQTQVTGYLQRNLTEAEATIVTNVIKAVTDWIDEYTGSSFAPSAADTARQFPGGERYLVIDPIIDIDLVEWLDPQGNVQATYGSGDYIAYPLNAVSKTQLELVRSIDGLGFDTEYANYSLRWPRYGTIRVTGKYGERDGIPDDIRLAATIMTAKWLVDNASNIKLEIIEGYRVERFDPSVQDANVLNILESHKRIRL